jgi:hypothetical protein
MAFCGYIGLLLVVAFFGMLGVTCGMLAGLMTKSTLVASLTSFLLYSVLLFAFCWFLYQTIGPERPGANDALARANASMRASAIRAVIGFGTVSFVVGGSICAIIPIVQRRSSDSARTSSPFAER